MKSASPYIAVVGIGAVGSLVAASLRRAGHSVLLVSSKAGTQRLRRQGLTTVDTKGKRRTLKGWLSIEHKPKKRAGCSAIIVCVKEPQLTAALKAIRPLIGPETAGLSLLNGIAHAAAFKRCFGPRRAVLGITFFGAMRTSPTVARHTGGALIAFGRNTRNANARRHLAKLLKGAGWHIKQFADEQRLLWTKMVFNSGVNPLGALTHASNGHLAKHPVLRELMGRVVREAAGIARAAGHPPLYPNVTAVLERNCRARGEQKNSMVQDMIAGRRSEIDSILLPLLRAAKRHGRPTPLLAPLYRMVRALEVELK
jgi:2-dehydropantoate 2-reductase